MAVAVLFSKRIVLMKMAQRTRPEIYSMKFREAREPSNEAKD
jgi:hypothetical protein